MRHLTFVIIIILTLAPTAAALEYMQTDIMNVSSTPSLVVIPHGEAVAYNGRRWNNGDKYTGFSFNVDLRSYFKLSHRSMLFTDLVISTGYDSDALNVAPYMKTGIGMVHRLTPRISITGYVVPSFIVGGSVSESPWVNEYKGIVRHFSYATARPWSEYQGVELENYSLTTIQISISY